MLQTRPGLSLVSKVESSLQSFEAKMPIGFAAFSRCQNNHSEIRIVVPDSRDSPLMKKLKSVIEAMTNFSPEARISAANVEKRIDALRREVNAFTIIKFGHMNIPTMPHIPIPPVQGSPAQP